MVLEVYQFSVISEVEVPVPELGWEEVLDVVEWLLGMYPGVSKLQPTG